MNEKKSFYVIGMSCAGCAANIQQALSERKGVIEARVNFAASDVIVEYNPTLVSDKDLQKTVQEAVRNTNQKPRTNQQSFRSLH